MWLLILMICFDYSKAESRHRILLYDGFFFIYIRYFYATWHSIGTISRERKTQAPNLKKKGHPLVALLDIVSFFQSTYKIVLWLKHIWSKVSFIKFLSRFFSLSLFLYIYLVLNSLRFNCEPLKREFKYSR